MYPEHPPGGASLAELYILAHTEERVAQAIVLEGNRPVLLELVKQERFYSVRGFDAAAGLAAGELTRWRFGSFGRELVAEWWHDRTGDWAAANEILAGRL